MRNSSKRMSLTIVLTLLVLFLVCFSAILISEAIEIRDTMRPEVDAAAVQAGWEFIQANDSMDGVTDQRTLAWTYQKAMVENRDGLGVEYPYRCASFLVGYDGTILYQSHTGFFATILWGDGTKEEIPMVFEYENTADLAQLIAYRDDIVNAAYSGYVEFTGYWKDGLFMVRQMDTSGYIKHHESPLEPPADAEIETITVACTGKPDATSSSGTTRPYSAYKVNAESFQLEIREKSYAGEAGYAAYADGWQKTDDLVAEFYQRYLNCLDEYGLSGVGTSNLWQPWDTSLLRIRCVGVQRVRDYGRLGGGDYMNLVYAAEFSPLRLAMKNLMTSPLMYVVLALFLGAGAFLLTSCSYAMSNERREYRDEIARQKQALEYAKGAEQSRREMTSAIAHELKTPIAVLSSYSEALQENIDADKQSHYLSVIREETVKMDQMVLELLDLSRLEAGKYKLKRVDFDLEKLAREIILPLTDRIEEKDLTISWQVTEPMVNGDRYRLGQVVENFMTNAIRHTPQGGKIVIRIGSEQETLSVENQGKPIPMEQLSKVWETFWQGDASRNEKGSGLGLSICRTIITLHGGSCKAENTPAGVRFSVSLNDRQKLYQKGAMPEERPIRLLYPIAQQYTTVERVLTKLELLSEQGLKRELRTGNVRVGSQVVRDPKTKLCPHYVLSWREYEITVCLDDTDKRRALLMERLTHGNLYNSDPQKASGYTPVKW